MLLTQLLNVLGLCWARKLSNSFVRQSPTDKSEQGPKFPTRLWAWLWNRRIRVRFKLIYLKIGSPQQIERREETGEWILESVYRILGTGFEMPVTGVQSSLIAVDERAESAPIGSPLPLRNTHPSIGLIFFESWQNKWIRNPKSLPVMSILQGMFVVLLIVPIDCQTQN